MEGGSVSRFAIVYPCLSVAVIVDTERATGDQSANGVSWCTYYCVAFRDKRDCNGQAEQERYRRRSGIVGKMKRS